MYLSRQAKKWKCNIVFTCYVRKCSPLVGWLVMEILNSQTLTPADICTFADGNWSLTPPPPLSVSSSFAYLCRAHREEERGCCTGTFSGLTLSPPVVWNQLPLGSEKLEWVSSPLPKDVKTSALSQLGGG